MKLIMKEPFQEPIPICCDCFNLRCTKPCYHDQWFVARGCIWGIISFQKPLAALFLRKAHNLQQSIGTVLRFAFVDLLAYDVRALKDWNSCTTTQNLRPTTIFCCPTSADKAPTDHGNRALKICLPHRNERWLLAQCTKISRTTEYLEHLRNQSHHSQSLRHSKSYIRLYLFLLYVRLYSCRTVKTLEFQSTHEANILGSKEDSGKIAISLSTGYPRKHFRANRFGNNSRKIDVGKLFFYELPVPSCVAPSCIVVIAFAYERGFDPQLGGM
ncbi:hypothetical protein AVEN_241053-1 [Araneus ventricosus]|uniref:Uncharacterized protein n=1 Tax=Araneus ventricosus TaxID=182803 RepID=A0A4Y2LCB7_ARAVE|nr:hypothetical protein AVEN_241053-1 [Araneus ventricosus]